MVIPCAKYKCLKYPICKAKEKIECNNITDWFIKAYREGIDVVYIVRKELPNMKSLLSLNNPYSVTEIHILENDEKGKFFYFRPENEEGGVDIVFKSIS